MFTSVVAALALAASVSQVTASPINHVVRNYAQDAELLEDYKQYHIRYIALNCQGQHNTTFFDECCHPLLKSQKLSDRPGQCIPSASASSSAALVEPSAAAVDEDPVGDDCDDDEDDDECTSEAPTSSYGKPTSTKLVTSYVATPTITSKSSSYAAPETSTTKEAQSYVPETTKAAPSTTKEAPATTKEATSYSAPEPTTTQKPSTTKAATTAAAPTSSAAPSTGGGDAITGGFATFFYQGGVAGACGDVHSDSDYVVAAQTDRYGALNEKSALCGKKVLITNTKNGKQVTAIVADACPTCTNENCLDLSEGAFTQIATKDEGEVPISWTFL